MGRLLIQELDENFFEVRDVVDRFNDNQRDGSYFNFLGDPSDDPDPEKGELWIKKI